jgi:hypothetical protein
MFVSIRPRRHAPVEAANLRGSVVPERTVMTLSLTLADKLV